MVNSSGVMPSFALYSTLAAKIAARIRGLSMGSSKKIDAVLRILNSNCKCRNLQLSNSNRRSQAEGNQESFRSPKVTE